MDPELTLLHTDLVDSTALNARVGDVAMAALWNTHDRDSRDLLRRWRGREIDRSDGFMVLFDATTDAAGFAADYHRMLAALPTPMQARAGIHIGALQLRENNVADIALGAKPLEVLGIAKALSARLMALAQGGQTLASPGAAAALQGGAWRCQSHGHWRMKGIDAPLEVFEVGDDSAAFVPPPDSQKAQRVVLIGGEWVGAQQVPHNLPAERDSWVGRAADLQALAQQLHDGARLVTLHGTGGMGKTRLALRYAWAWLGEHPGGVWFCDLSQARGLDGLLQAVAQGLDVPLGNDPAAQLGRAIAGRGRCLVILDNFEQIARHARDSVGRWLDAAPAAHFIVTSREVLGLVGERMFSVSPIGSDDAVALFQQRARAADRNYDPAGADPATLQSLVELLDYLPLAIELAAPRVRVMPVAELLARMGDRFRLLAGARGRPERQATLHGALQWSWELLDGAEQAALAQVSVFEGGFTLAAAEAVVDLSGCDPAPWLVDVLQSLIDRSLLRRSEVGRFGLLRSVQEFAASKLHATWSSRSLQAAGTSAAALQRHCTYFAQLEEAEAAAQRSVELDNIIAACRVAGRSNDPSCATACLDH